MSNTMNDPRLLSDRELAEIRAGLDWRKRLRSDLLAHIDALTADLAATIRVMIEAVQARHVKRRKALVPPGSGWPPTGAYHVCSGCGGRWPCDAARLADMLAQAVTALEWYEDRRHYWDYEGLNDIYADEGDRARSALRRMAGGE